MTKGNECDIIVKLSARAAARSLKIEQQEEKYKAKQSAKYILVKKSYIYSYKVKEAKIKLELRF